MLEHFNIPGGCHRVIVSVGRFIKRLQCIMNMLRMSRVVGDIAAVEIIFFLFTHAHAVGEGMQISASAENRGRTDRSAGQHLLHAWIKIRIGINGIFQNGIEFMNTLRIIGIQIHETAASYIAEGACRSALNPVILLSVSDNVLQIELTLRGVVRCA